MNKTAPFSMRLEPELKAELQRLAEADQRSLTNYVEVILGRHVAKLRQSDATIKHAVDSR